MECGEEESSFTAKAITSPTWPSVNHKQTAGLPLVLLDHSVFEKLLQRSPNKYPVDYLGENQTDSP